MEDLSASRSPLAPIVQAHLSAQIVGKDVAVGYEKKLSLIKSLYERGYGREDIVQLFRLIDWFIGLPQREEERLWSEIQTLGEETKMPYITSVERIGIRKGLEQGLERGVLEGQITKGQEDIIRILEFRFENIPPKLREIINKIKDLNVLGNLLIQAVTLQSVEEFQSLASQYLTEDELELPATEQNPPQKADESE